MRRSDRVAVVMCALVVPLIAMAVALRGTVTVLSPVIVFGLVALFLAGRAIGRRDDGPAPPRIR